MKNLILIAIQGAGKGTLAKELSKKYGYVHISTGDLLRERAMVRDELGDQIRDLIDQGKFVSDEIIFDAISDKITSPACQNGYILDGFPRNMTQAVGYDELLKKVNQDIGIVIHLTVPEEILESRILGRRTCLECGSIYNIYSKDFCPKVEGICDKCGSTLTARKDDNLESLKKRLETYHEVTKPLIDYYKNKGILYEVESVDSKKTLIKVDKILEELGD